MSHASTDRYRRYRQMNRAHVAVKRAVDRGDIPPACTLTCVDCGKPAEHYDHRDYAKPLDVEPTCRTCNYRRGPGLNRALPEAEQLRPVK